MYELIRNKHTFTITKPEGSGGRFQQLSGVTPLALERNLEKTVWRQFVKTGRSDKDSVKPSVAESWQRCLQMGVDPGKKRCMDFREEKALDTDHHFLREVVKDTGRDLSTFLDEKGLLLTVCDRHGYLTGMLGSYQTLQQADSLHFGPGANWTEQSVGTNAIGTALVSGLPQRVVGREHFCASHHGWICSAAPIFGTNGALLGCVDISGPVQSDHSHTLALAVYYARAIEMVFFQKSCMGMMGKVLNENAIGLLALDQHGRIGYCNGAAAEMFGSPLPGLLGRDASKWFDLSPVLDQKSETRNPDPDEVVELSCLLNPTWRIYASPLLHGSQTVHGMALCLCRPAPVTAPLGRQARLEKGDDAFTSMIGSSEAFRRLTQMGRRVANTDATVLLTGPSGTGKEVMARALHQTSSRVRQPFVAINCGAIAADLIQSELFGYAEGAFTGAGRGGQSGKFEQASGGTLFLDEIGEMPLAIQVNLLRVLDEKQVVRVGGKQPVPVDVRIVAATNQDLEAMVAAGAFRQDLYFRLHVVHLTMPRLSERGDDVQLLADHFIRHFSKILGRRIDGVTPGFRRALAAYDWPGNIRELRHLIESIMILMDDDAKLCAELLPERMRNAGGQGPSSSDHRRHQPDLHFPTFNLDEVQKEVLRQALVQYDGNITRVARALGVGRNTTYAKLKKFNLL